MVLAEDVKPTDATDAVLLTSQTSSNANFNFNVNASDIDKDAAQILDQVGVTQSDIENTHRSVLPTIWIKTVSGDLEHKTS